jgi:hypothetical protein
MSCSGCLLTEKEKQQQIQDVSAKAKQYAIECKKMVVLYWLSDKQVDYMVADAAKSAGISPIKYISHLQ